MDHPAPAEHPGVDLYQWFDLSDLLITDVSSLLSDFMAWDRPYVVTNPSRMSTSLLHAEFPTTRSAYIVEPGSPTTRLVLGNALETDPLRASRSETRRYFLGDPDQDPLDLFNRAVDRLYEKTPTHSA
jgi:CDP-glycerol glycerophosphotransferase (TagB/SpsB family)